MALRQRDFVLLNRVSAIDHDELARYVTRFFAGQKYGDMANFFRCPSPPNWCLCAG